MTNVFSISKGIVAVRRKEKCDDCQHDWRRCQPGWAGDTPCSRCIYNPVKSAGTWGRNEFRPY